MNFQQFLKEYQELKQKFPKRPNHTFRSENSDFGDILYQCKNAYYCFDTSDSQDIVYIFDSYLAKNCVDGDYVIESENCYECVDTVKSNNCTFVTYSNTMIESHFCYDCTNCTNVFGCVNLRNKQYCIFNKQYEKEEYEKKVEELLKRPYEENLAELEELKKKFPLTQTKVLYSENCDYCNMVFDGKNCYLCFDAAFCQNCSYLYDSHRNKYCYDMTQSHRNEWLYECTDANHSNNSIYLTYCNALFDSAFCEECSDSNNLLGCVALSNSEYCILNKQYTQEEYEKIKGELMESFRKSAS